jgi:hypothetical protein
VIFRKEDLFVSILYFYCLYYWNNLLFVLFSLIFYFGTGLKILSFISTH